MAAGLSSSPALAQLGCCLACQTEPSVGNLPCGRSADEPCRRTAGSNTLQAPGMAASARGACQSCSPPFPPSCSSSLPTGCIHFSFQTCLGICLGPTAIKLDLQPRTCLPCAEAVVWLRLGSRKQPRSSRALPQRSLSWLQASLGSYLISPPSASSPFC